MKIGIHSNCNYLGNTLLYNQTFKLLYLLSKRIIGNIIFKFRNISHRKKKIVLFIYGMKNGFYI